MVLLRVPVDTSDFLDEQFQGPDDTPIYRTAFFDPVDGAAPGRLVKTRGEQARGTVIWGGAELEE